MSERGFLEYGSVLGAGRAGRAGRVRFKGIGGICRMEVCRVV